VIYSVLPNSTKIHLQLPYLLRFNSFHVAYRSM
jgi:hypothetical protein